MKKSRIFPLLLLVLPFVYGLVFRLGIKNKEEINKHLLLLIFVWILLFLIFLISNILIVSIKVSHGGKSNFFLFWNMMMKLFHIPIYLLIFFVGLLMASLPGAIMFVPFLMVFDYMLLLLTSIYGIAGIVQARREKKFTTITSVMLGILHFFFFTDVICSVVAFCLCKSKDKELIS